MSKLLWVTSFLGGFLGVSETAIAWGHRGHQSICEAATFLVSEAALKEFLSPKGPRMGHLCNIPDTYWRSLSQEETHLGNPTHYINPENLQKTLKNLDTNYSRVRKSGTEDLHSKVGSIWWRAQQFFDHALAAGSRAKKSVLPKNPLDEQNPELPYNAAIYEMHVNMGLLGHFVGDVAMPFHNRVDYDGRSVGHAGIHSFYESTCVNEFGPELTSLIVDEARQLKNEDFLAKRSNAVKRMKAMSVKAAPEAEKILELDTVVEKSGPDRRAAVRKSPAEACPVFRPMLVSQMSRSARLLALMWDEIYVKAGRPELQAYRSYRYPFQPEFVAPNYL
jgi:hypothetical protein